MCLWILSESVPAKLPTQLRNTGHVEGYTSLLNLEDGSCWAEGSRARE